MVASRYYGGRRAPSTRLFESTDNKLGDDEIDHLRADVTWYVDAVTIESPVLGSLISSGDLAIISNGELRRQLGTWSIKLNTVRSGIHEDLRFYNDTLMPFINKHV